ncbi:hypothetical protein N9D23_13100 [Rubripirellula sp.]|nr:hypothetical protein [Rubripirellula sp.]
MARELAWYELAWYELAWYELAWDELTANQLSKREPVPDLIVHDPIRDVFAIRRRHVASIRVMSGWSSRRSQNGFQFGWDR